MAPMLMEAIAKQIPATDKDFPETSIIMPCLKDADAVAACIGKARRALNEHKIVGEIIVADNGSTDGNQAISDEAQRPPDQRTKMHCLESTGDSCTVQYEFSELRY
jgi:glycosyltransferase involved in cell wall biosynthesis